MGSEWAREADRQAQMLTRDLSEVGLPKSYKVEYQRREARFALKTRGGTLYFVARDFETAGGPDWLGLRLAVLSAAAESRRGTAAARGAEVTDRAGGADETDEDDEADESSGAGEADRGRDGGLSEDPVLSPPRPAP